MVSSKDVAKHAGVSQTTVSRVINTPELVKAKTLKKVLRSIEELQYIPNALARSLVQNKTGTIALLSGPLHNPFFVDTTNAIVKYANEKGYRINVQFVTDQELEVAYNSVLEHKVDGVILSCIFLDDTIFEKLERAGIPFITYNRKHQSNVQFVEIDNFQAGYLAAQHLIESGHTNIAWIGGSLGLSTYKYRFKGFLKCLNDYNINLTNSYYFHSHDTQLATNEAFYSLFNGAESPTAICAGADTIAFSVLDIAIKENYRIPEDLSIIGIDNVDLSSHSTVQLTTVGATSGVNLGALAIEKLIEMIENKENTCIQITEPVRMFCRNTVARI